MISSSHLRHRPTFFFSFFLAICSSHGLFFFLLLLFFASIPTSHSATHPDDVNALVAIADAWGQKANDLQWVGTDPCGSKWLGIVCDNTTSPYRVTDIGLSGLGMSGLLVDDIGNLASLQTLDLSYNNLSGPLPTKLSQLSNLQRLLLQYNSFTGSIPAEYGQLKNLTYLALNGNQLSGSLPNEIGLLSKLYWLDVAFNQLSGTLPYSSDGKSTAKVGLDNLTNAQHFHLNNNSFAGTIPSTMCHQGMVLIHLLLDSNQLTGSIPPELGQCSSLLIMKLTNNKLSGTIPSSISQLSNLTELQLSYNSLIGTLPDLSNLTHLSILDLSHNTFTGVLFPSWLSNLLSLTDLIIENAAVSGEIPATFFAVHDLETVRLANNKINGTLDLSLTTNQLKLIDLQNNQIQLLTLGTYNAQADVLRLQGNQQVCSLTAYQNTYCGSSSSGNGSGISSGNVYSSNASGCAGVVTCAAPQEAAPPATSSNNAASCMCALPYKGLLIFRAPLFTTLFANATENAALFQPLLDYIVHNLMISGISIDSSHVIISSATFNSQLQLLVYISIFPPSGIAVWSVDNVITLSYVLGNEGIHIDNFGPPMFYQYNYAYTVNGESSGGGGGIWSSLGAKVGIGVGVGVVLLLVIALVSFGLFQKRRADKAVEEQQKSPFASWPGLQSGDSNSGVGSVPKLQGARYFTYKELAKATDNFSDKNAIGSGGYGKVYRGVVGNGEEMVAIKRAQKDSMQGAGEFKNEIELLSRVHHRNVVGLVGFCFEQGEQMLVYEYMANGNLRDGLLGRSPTAPLSWRRRLMIALGAARGLSYLHELVTPAIIHRDIKSTNILLDHKSIAKVADFGLSKAAPDGGGDQEVGMVTQVKGTMGYLDPEYYHTQQLSEKSDVYSYGVVLLELITARAPIMQGSYVVNEVRKAAERGGGAVWGLVDKRLQEEVIRAQEAATYGGGGGMETEIIELMRVALACVADTGVERPSMGEVVKRLEELVSHDYPDTSGEHGGGGGAALRYVPTDASSVSSSNTSSYLPSAVASGVAYAR